MYELLFVQGKTSKNRGRSTSVATGESQEQLLDLMKSELAKKGIFPPYYRIITKEDRMVIDYGSYTSKYIIKKV